MLKSATAALACACLGTTAAPALAEDAPLPPGVVSGQRLEMPSPFASVPGSGFTLLVPDDVIAVELRPEDPIVEDHAALREQAEAVLSVLDSEATEEDLRGFVDVLYDLQLEFGVVLALWDTSNDSYCEFLMVPMEMDEVTLDDFAAAQVDAESSAPLAVTLSAGPTRLSTYTQDVVEGAYYVGYGDDVGYGLDVLFAVDCRGPERPEDDWRYVIETLEWLPEEA